MEQEFAQDEFDELNLNDEEAPKQDNVKSKIQTAQILKKGSHQKEIPMEGFEDVADKSLKKKKTKKVPFFDDEESQSLHQRHHHHA